MTGSNGSRRHVFRSFGDFSNVCAAEIDWNCLIHSGTQLAGKLGKDDKSNNTQVSVSFYAFQLRKLVEA